MPFGSSRLPSCVQRESERRGREREKTRTIGPHWSTIAQHAVSVATQRQPRRKQLRRDIPAVEIVDPHKTCLCSITLLGIVSVTKNKSEENLQSLQPAEKNLFGVSDLTRET